jgi:NitT/TauT family transport system permease protein/taurine transport system permease protein
VLQDKGRLVGVRGNVVDMMDVEPARCATSRAGMRSRASRAGADRETAAIAIRRAPARRPWPWARAAKGAIGVLLLLVAWQVSVRGGTQQLFYPAPSDVVAAFADLIRKGILPVYLADSLLRYLAGLTRRCAGHLVGVLHRRSIAGFARVVAAAALHVRHRRSGLDPDLRRLVRLRAEDDHPRAGVCRVLPVLYNTLLGVRTAPQLLVNGRALARCEPLQVLRLVILPAALPGIITACGSAGLRVRGLVFARSSPPRPASATDLRGHADAADARTSSA